MSFVDKIDALFRRPKNLELTRGHIIDAYGRLFNSLDGQTVLEDMVRSFMLRSSKDQFEEGERNVVLRILALVKEAEHPEHFKQGVNRGE